ncbi:small G protein signaling modulator 1-like isoform X2 [Oppia nitens]|uniref:small G protein signaling modulator 1-like isoform X2 n=1 Tax=Oppia nitens TaxID=1686743 RepID=UPI0023DCD4D6|nr:small G protein signaling modulator 1-like isoform X2 [Oppia nitens]
MGDNSEKEYKEKLLRMVKREVKQIMEEAVTRKFVHEESSSITSLCAAVEACLSYGLKRRALGLFKTNSTTALLQKVAKSSEPAAIVLKIVTDLESNDPNKRSSSSSDSINKNRITKAIKQQSTTTTKPVVRYLWIRIALFEKHLVSIVDHLVSNSNKYYEKEALVSDPVAGQILASLLVGPCALDYSKMKTQDHFWTDPPADELVQRHRLSGSVNGPSTPPIGRKPLGLYYKRGVDGSKSSTSADEKSPPVGRSSISWSPRDYVESLHQNSRSTLLYGKNNVLIQPRENMEAIPGYLSLHSTHIGLIIKWTPNQLMNGCTPSFGELTNDSVNSLDKSTFWEYALSLSVDEIVYLHCHQQEGSDSIVLVGQDGVMQPPIRFPKGGHLLSFLSCLENGLMPYGQLDPPLWSQKGKVFPKLRRKGRGSTKNRKTIDANLEEEDDEPCDYVFRIIATFEKPETIPQELIYPNTIKGAFYLKRPFNGMKRSNNTSPHKSPNKTSDVDDSDKKSNESLNNEDNCEHKLEKESEDKSNLKQLCVTMKRQIISRAFYGWLAYCRHLRTVRTHLADLINTKITNANEPIDAFDGITEELWKSIKLSDGKISDANEVYRYIYFGGIQHSLRKTVWPYLLGHYSFDMSDVDKSERDKEVQQNYELLMSEWLAVEAIVRQRDKEIVAANLAKLSSESNNSADMPLTGPKDHNFSNEVFEDISEGDESKPSSRKSSMQTPEQIKEGAIATAKRQLQRHKPVESQSSSQNIIVTNSSIDITNTLKSGQTVDNDTNEPDSQHLPIAGNGESNSQCVSPVSSNGGVYTNELLDLFSLNIHRIDKDVQRCDRNFWYFTNENLEKLRNVMCSYVWEHLDIGYVQGMCDLVAPLLVIYDEEVLTYSCFCELMKRMVANFPHGGAMDAHFANMRSLIQILDAEMFELMHQNGDYTHFYFCYRWFLLDFKRELVYDDVFAVWETIWSAKYISSSSFVLFIALALVEYYRDIILENNMDFTDIIKFFNEMAERHDAKAVLKIARDLVLQIQTLIDNK